MKKTSILLFVLLISKIGFSQTYSHETRVKLKTVNELPTPTVTDKVLVLDPVTFEVKYVEAQSMPIDTSDLMTLSTTQIATATKTFNTNDDTSNIISSNASATAAGIESVNTGSGAGISSSNTSDGAGIYNLNTSSGVGLVIENSGAFGEEIINTNTGIGLELINVNIGKALSIANLSTGMGVELINQSSGTAFDLINANTGNGLLLENLATGVGVILNNYSGGYGMASNNDGAGQGIVANNTNTGIGLYDTNTGTGTGFKCVNYSSGDGIVSNGDALSTGYVYIGQDGGFNTFTVNKEGDISSNSLIVANTINGIDASSLMALNTPQTVTKTKTFNTGDNSEGIILESNSIGPAFFLENYSSGGAIIVNSNASSTGYNYVGQDDNDLTFSVDKKGLITSKATAADILTTPDAVLTKNYKPRGVLDYNDASTTTTPIDLTLAGGYVYLPNDGLGVNTNKLYPPTGVTDTWDTTLNQFDFTQLSLGSKVHFRFSATITTTGTNQTAEVDLDLGIGSSNPYTLDLYIQSFKTAGTYTIIFSDYVYMGNLETRDYPAKFKIKSDGNASVVVNGWACDIDLY